MKFKKLILLASCIFMLLGCNSGDNGGGDPPPVENVTWKFELNEDQESYIVSIESINATALFDMVVPNEHEGKPVTTVGYSNRYWIYGYSGSQYVKSITFPDTITSLNGNGLLKSLDNLERVVLSKNCETIPNSCFYNCPKLSEVVIPEGVTKIDQGAFNKTTALESVTFPTTLVTIKENAFTGSGINEINWAASIKDDNKLQIERNAFKDCRNLEEVIMPNYVYCYTSSEKYFSNSWFDGCRSLKKFKMSGLVQAMSNEFAPSMGPYLLEEFVIPQSVIYLGSRSLFFSSYDFANIKTITFEGSKSEWLAIEKETDYLDSDEEVRSVLTKVHTLEDDQTFSIR